MTTQLFRVRLVATLGVLLLSGLRSGTSGAVDAGAAAPRNTCVESIPQGMQRPVLVSRFPDRGISGHLASWVVELEHGKGENVLPRGLELERGSALAKTLHELGFVIPEQDSGMGARLSIVTKEGASPDRETSQLEFPILLLPAKFGRQILVLPSLPIAVARANGEVATVCSPSHSIIVEDPNASSADAVPRSNPPPRPQREEWIAFKRAVIWVACGIALGILAVIAVAWWRRRPKRIPPPPPPRPPWEIAIERLDEVRHAGLLDVERFGEYFDRVSDTVRAYLGARFGFDGLESTSDEIIAALRPVRQAGVALPELILFLQECDLVKFANVTPTPEACARALAAGEAIVRATMPTTERRHKPAIEEAE